MVLPVRLVKGGITRNNFALDVLLQGRSYHVISIYQHKAGPVAGVGVMGFDGGFGGGEGLGVVTAAEAGSFGLRKRGNGSEGHKKA